MSQQYILLSQQLLFYEKKTQFLPKATQIQQQSAYLFTFTFEFYKSYEIFIIFMDGSIVIFYALAKTTILKRMKNEIEIYSVATVENCHTVETVI